MTSPATLGGPPRTPSLRDAGAFVVSVALLFLLGGALLGSLLGEAGLLAAEWLLLFLPATLWVERRGFDPIRTFSLRAAPARSFAGALVLGAGAMPLVWTVGWLQTFVLPVPWEMLEGMQALLSAESGPRLIWLLLVVAATPAVCEEFVFRGVVLSALRRLPPARMIVLNGLVFGAFHLSLSTLVRFLPTAVLGCVIAWAVWRSGSIWVGVAMHFVNNATIVLIASVPALAELFSDPLAPPPLASIVVGAIAFAMGIGILLRTAPYDGGDPTNSPTDT